MSISPTKRKQACTYLLNNEFDIDGTVDWMLNEFADDPALSRAKNKDKLCRNIITIGGSGTNQYLNLVAFQQALHEYNNGLWLKQEHALQARIRDLQAERNTYRERAADAEARARDKTDQVIDLERKLSNSERQTLTLQLQAGKEPVSV